MAMKATKAGKPKITQAMKAMKASKSGKPNIMKAATRPTAMNQKKFKYLSRGLAIPYMKNMFLTLTEFKKNHGYTPSARWMAVLKADKYIMP